MKISSSLLLFVLLAAFTASPKAEACGLKLTVKSAKGQRPVPPSPNPSRVLLVGRQSGSLSRILAQAGHEVEVADEPAAAKGSDYEVVMVGDQHRAAAESRYPDARVVSYASASRSSWRRVELALKRAPVDAKADRTVVAARGNERELVAAASEGPGNRQLVEAGGDAQPQRAAAPTPAPSATRDSESAASVEPASESEPSSAPDPSSPAAVASRAEPESAAEPDRSGRSGVASRAARNEPTRTRRRTPRVSGRIGPGRVGFQFGSSRLSAGSRRGLRRTARYLKSNPDVTVRIEGHTDSIGTSEFNLNLSQRRAGRVRSALRRYGVPESRISVQAFGEENPPFSPPRNPRNRCVIIQLSDR